MKLVKLAKPLALQWLMRMVAMLAAYVAIMLGLHLYLGKIQQQHALEVLPDRIQQQFMPLLAQSVWDVDNVTTRHLLQGLLTIEGVSQITLLNPKGVVQWQLGKPYRISHQIELPVQSSTTPPQALGTLRLGLSWQQLEWQQWQHLLLMLAELGAGLLLAGGFGYRFLQQQIAAPLQQMANEWLDGTGNTPIAQDEVALVKQAMTFQAKQLGQQGRQLQQEKQALAQQRDHLSTLLAMRTAELEQLSRFHQLIAELSGRLAQLNQHSLAGEIAIALARIGTLLEVDRCYLFRVNAAMRIHQTQEWCRSGIQSTAHLYESYPLHDSAWFVPQLLKQHLVALSQLEDMPPEGQSERQRFSQHSIQSIAVVTLSYQGQILGFFGCDTVLQKRDWQDKELTLMRLFSEMLSTVLLQQQYLAELQASRHQLSQAQEKIDNIANVDSLTGLGNQKNLQQQLQRAFRQAEASGHGLSILQIDVDQMRAFNQRFGYAEGDQCLIRLAALLQQHFPGRHHLLARSSGNRFVVLLPGMDLPTSLAVAENVRLAVWQLAISHPQSPEGSALTISIGACSYDAARHDSPAALLQESEDYLQQAKQQGRNAIAGPAYKQHTPP